MNLSEVPVQKALELACAAQRTNRSYIKIVDYVMSADGKVLATKHPNKFLMMFSMGLVTNIKPEDAPDLLKITDEDKELADQIRKFFRRLMFSAVQGENEFQTNVNSILESENVHINKLGFVACLPSVYSKEHGELQVEKKSRIVDEGFLASIGSTVLDCDCEVLSCRRSKNFDAFNIDAIVNNKMVSWMSKNELKLGACVIIKAHVKDHASHWKHGNSVTRLNYVKAAQ